MITPCCYIYSNSVLKVLNWHAKDILLLFLSTWWEQSTQLSFLSGVYPNYQVKGVGFNEISILPFLCEAFPPLGGKKENQDLLGSEVAHSSTLLDPQDWTGDHPGSMRPWFPECWGHSLFCLCILSKTDSWYKSKNHWEKGEQQGVWFFNSPLARHSPALVVQGCSKSEEGTALEWRVLNSIPVPRTMYNTLNSY